MRGILDIKSLLSHSFSWIWRLLIIIWQIFLFNNVIIDDIWFLSIGKHFWKLIWECIQNVLSIWSSQFKLGCAILLLDTNHGRHDLNGLIRIPFYGLDKQKTVIHETLWSQELSIALDHVNHTFLGISMNLQFLIVFTKIKVFEYFESRWLLFLLICELNRSPNSGSFEVIYPFDVHEISAK